MKTFESNVKINGGQKIQNFEMSQALRLKKEDEQFKLELAKQFKLSKTEKSPEELENAHVRMSELKKLISGHFSVEKDLMEDLSYQIHYKLYSKKLAYLDDYS